ncbi:antitoxin [soil metagenome]
MVKRFQVLLEEDELRAIQRQARWQRLTTAEWVRRALRSSIDTAPAPDVADKLRAVRAASAHAFPVADIEVMLAQIERGYGDAAAGQDRG